MNNERFRYLMDNDPEKVITKKGVKTRKKINPAFNLLLKVINPYSRNVERKAEMPKDKPTIYVASHGFRDDILNSYLTINDNVYVLFGVIDQFFKTIDGLKLWLSGVILVDRENKESRAASKLKMARVLKLGAGTIDFFEATWNLSPNLLVAKPHVGVYDVAKKSEIEVAPLTTHVQQKRFRSKCHSILGERYDITKITYPIAKDTIKIITKDLIKVSDLLIYGDKDSINIKNRTNELLIKLRDGLTDEPYFNLEKLSALIDTVSQEAAEIRATIQSMMSAEDIDEIKKSIMKRCANLFKVIMYAQKIVAVNELRDQIASHKYELMEKYSNFSNVSRSQLEKKETLEEQWNKYVKKLKKQVKYYDPKREQTYLFKDPTEYDKEEVFPKVYHGKARVLSIPNNNMR